MQLGLRPAIVSAWSGGEQVGYQLPGRWLVPSVFAVIGFLAGIGEWGLTADWFTLGAVAVTLVQWVLIGWLALFWLIAWVFALGVAFGILERAWGVVRGWNERARAEREVAERADREAEAMRLR